MPVFGHHHIRRRSTAVGAAGASAFSARAPKPPAQPATDTTRPPARPKRWRLWLDVALALVGITIAVWRLAPAVAAVDDLGGRLGHLRWGIVAVAVALAVAALLAYGELQRQLLVDGGGNLPGRTVQAVTFVANAITNTVPTAGGAAGTAYQVGAFKKRGVDTTLSVWVVFLAGLITSVILLIIAPVLLAGNHLLSIPTGAAVSGFFLLCTGLAWWVLRRPAKLRWVTGVVVRVARRIPIVRRAEWAGQNPSDVADQIACHVAMVRPRPAQWGLLVGVALASWLFDYLGLVAWLAATTRQIPWTAVAVGYLAVQASIALQLTPGGTGPAETGLLAALLAGGVPPATAAITVVLYRGITWIGLPLSGWCVFLYLAEHRPGKPQP